jgi:Domain of unknown function (DUF4157)/ADP-ribosyltransferase exoenzyme
VKKSDTSSTKKVEKSYQSQPFFAGHIPLQMRSFAPLQQIKAVPQDKDHTQKLGHRIENISFAPRSPVDILARKWDGSGERVQAKLAIGSVGDKYEQEADQVASQVVQKINAPKALSANKDKIHMKPVSHFIQREGIGSVEKTKEFQRFPTLQRREAGISGGMASDELENSIHQARGKGQHLDRGLQQKMGNALGADFSRVKVHTDLRSDQLNQSIQAKAFTTGQDVFFRQGAYAPSSRGGQELIAHELTHVVQQSGKVQPLISDHSIQRTLAVKPADLQGSLSKTAKVKGLLGRESTFSEIQKLLTEYHEASDEPRQYGFLLKLKPLVEDWLDNHQPSEENDNEKAKQASLKHLQLAIHYELGTILKVQADYIKDMDADEFKFMTKLGKLSTKTAGSVQGEADKHGLTKAELSAIRIYTAADYAYMNPVLADNDSWLDFKVKDLSEKSRWDFGKPDPQGSKKTTLNDDERQQIKREGKQHSDMASMGLQKLPDIKMETYRGIGLTKEDFEAQYQVGKEILFKAFTSTSKKRDGSQSFANSEAKGGKLPILMVLKVTKGKDIDNLSSSQGEGEILLAPGSKFKVEKIIAPKTTDGSYTVNVRQVS